MNTNQFVGVGLILSVVLAFFIAIVVVPTDQVLANSLYTFDGMMFFVFGIWGGVKLLTLKKGR